MPEQRLQLNQKRGLSQAEIDSFKAIYQTRFNKRLNDQEALTLGLRLLDLIKAVYKPIKRSI